MQVFYSALSLLLTLAAGVVLLRTGLSLTDGLVGAVVFTDLLVLGWLAAVGADRAGRIEFSC